MELIDYNDKYIRNEIKNRTKRIKKTDGVGRDKVLFAYTFYRNDIGDQVAEFRKAAMNDKKYRCVIEGLSEMDEVMCLKKLHHDTKNKVFYF